MAIQDDLIPTGEITILTMMIDLMDLALGSCNETLVHNILLKFDNKVVILKLRANQDI